MHEIIEIFVKICAAIGPVIGFYEFFVNKNRTKKKDLREDFNFSYRFFRDLKTIEILSPVLVEKGFNAVAGTDRLSAAEIKYTLTLPTPLWKLRLYEKAKKYLKYDNKRDGNKVLFAKGYSNSLKRKCKKCLWLILYIVLYFIVAIPVLLIPSVFMYGNLFTNIVAAIIIMMFSILSLFQFARIEAAEVFIKNQNI
jgi:hypothetical protein